MTAIPADDSSNSHEPFYLSQAAFVLIHALVIITYYTDIPIPVFVALTVLAAIPAVWFSLRAMHHRASTCTHCNLAVVHATDDPSRYMPVFRISHLLGRPVEWLAKVTKVHPRDSSKPKLIAVTLASIAIVYTPVAVAVILVPFPWQFVTAFIGATAITRVITFHERLVMFCPLCRDDDGDDDEVVPDPTPAPGTYVT